MAEVNVYYHDPVEVDPTTSWTGLCKSLHKANRINIVNCNNNRVIDLFAYARPDAVITVDDVPAVSIEQTRMNPSGHNIPQRFAFQVRAAELGVPSILYYPAYSRRTFSDPNPRYLQVRVPLAQLRLSSLYKIPALSVFWPTDKDNLLPELNRDKHQEIADLVDALIINVNKKEDLLNIPIITSIISKMEDAISMYGSRYEKRVNNSVRQILPGGFSSSLTKGRFTIDPPNGIKLLKTTDFIRSTYGKNELIEWSDIKAKMMKRDLTLIYTATANNKKTDSEHPWPGYLTLFDILYARLDNGVTTHDRIANLIYNLPVDVSIFLERVNRKDVPTPTYIVDTFADLVILQGGIIAGRPMRNTNLASVVLKD